MRLPRLNRYDIFAEPVPFGPERYLLYAPLAGIMAECSKEEVLSLETDWNNDFVNAVLEETKPPLRMPDFDEINELTVLLNQRCNFHCRYCYSASGRDNSQIPLSVLLKAIDEFVGKRPDRALRLVFSGGGDPVLSFDCFKEGVLRAEECAQRCNSEVSFGIVTNGSTLRDEYIDFFKRHQIDLVISFDILEDVHNAQRSHYSVVAETVKQFIGAGIRPGIRATVTPLNVARQVEMVQVLHSDFKGIESAAFEAVLNPDLFENSGQLRRFYDDFIENLLAARKYAGRCGLLVGNTMIDNIETCKERACMGKVVVAPNGSLLGCSRISSPKETLFTAFHYGDVKETGICIDRARYDAIFGNNVETGYKCGGCIAKWHCSGGCLLAKYSLSEEYWREYCRFMRKMTVCSLILNVDGDD